MPLRNHPFGLQASVSVLCQICQWRGFGPRKVNRNPHLSPLIMSCTALTSNYFQLSGGSPFGETVPPTTITQGQARLDWLISYAMSFLPRRWADGLPSEKWRPPIEAIVWCWRPASGPQMTCSVAIQQTIESRVHSGDLVHAHLDVVSPFRIDNP